MPGIHAANCQVCQALPVPGPCCWRRTTVDFLCNWTSVPLIWNRVRYPRAHHAGDSCLGLLNVHEDFSRACAVFVAICELYSGDALLRATHGKPDALREVYAVGRTAAKNVATSVGHDILRILCHCVYDVASDYDATAPVWGIERTGDELTSRLLEDGQLADCMGAVLRMVNEGDLPMSAAMATARNLVVAFNQRLHRLRNDNLRDGRREVEKAASILQASGATQSYDKALTVLKDSRSVTYGHVDSVTMVALATLGVLVKTDRWVESALRCVAERCGGVSSVVRGRVECPVGVCVWVAPYKSVQAPDIYVALDGQTALKAAKPISFAVDWKQEFVTVCPVQGRFVTLEAVPRAFFPVVTAEIAELGHDLEQPSTHWKAQVFLQLKSAAVEGRPMEGTEAALAVAHLRDHLSTRYPQSWPILRKLYTTKAVAAAYATSHGAYRSFSLKLKQRLYVAILPGFTKVNGSDVLHVWSNGRCKPGAEMLAHDAIRTKRAWIRIDSRDHAAILRTNYIPDCHLDLDTYRRWEREHVPTPIETETEPEPADVLFS